jgi:hypothetical protein
MPYGYYQFVRFVACIAFGYFAFQESKHRSNWMFVYGGLSVLFQPFFKISLGRGLWNVIDVIVAVFLIVSMLKKNQIK